VPVPFCPLQAHVERTCGALLLLSNTSVVYAGKSVLYVVDIRGSNHSIFIHTEFPVSNIL
jgi:hypothetical protein